MSSISNDCFHVVSALVIPSNAMILQGRAWYQLLIIFIDKGAWYPWHSDKTANAAENDSLLPTNATGLNTEYNNILTPAKRINLE